MATLTKRVTIGAAAAVLLLVAVGVAAAKPDDATRGKRVYLRIGCGACHIFAAAGSKGAIGPNLDRTLRGKSLAYIRQSIVKPNAVVARGYRANTMPSTYGLQLSKQQIADLVAFLAEKRKR